jgi:tetratricopeptide (TPR) repeat protein
LGLGQTYFFQENPDLNEATKSFRRVVELKPDWVEGHHWLGAAQEKAGALEDAVKSYREAIRIAPSDTRPLIALGVCLTEMGQFAEAVVCLRSAVALNPPYAVASAHLFLGDALSGNGRTRRCLSGMATGLGFVIGLSRIRVSQEGSNKAAYGALHASPRTATQAITGEKSPLHSLTRILANKRRKLVLWPDFTNWGFLKQTAVSWLNAWRFQL